MTQLTFKAPSQVRSRETLGRIYDATNELLDENDFSKVKMVDISARAGVTIGSIYQRFGSKNDLLWWIYEAYLDDATMRLDTLFSGATQEVPEQRVQSLISIVCELWKTNTGIVRSLLLLSRQDGDAVPDRYRVTIEEIYKSSVRYLGGRDATEEHFQRATFAVSVIFATCREKILFHDQQRDDIRSIEQDRFAALLTQSIMGIFAPEGSEMRNGGL